MSLDSYDMPTKQLTRSVARAKVEVDGFFEALSPRAGALAFELDLREPNKSSTCEDVLLIHIDDKIKMLANSTLKSVKIYFVSLIDLVDLVCLSNTTLLLTVSSIGRQKKSSDIF